MVKEYLGQSLFLDDTDDAYDDYEEFEEDGLSVKGGQPLLKKELSLKQRKGEDSGMSKKRHKHDAKNRYWRKHRDDVSW